MKKELKEDINFYKTSKFDIFIIALVLFLSSSSMLGFSFNRMSGFSQPAVALIYQQGRLLERVDLGKDRIIAFLDGQMSLEVKNGRARVLNTDCPHHICKNMGWIKYNGETIVCVPNHVLIEIKSKGPLVIDAVAY